MERSTQTAFWILHILTQTEKKIDQRCFIFTEEDSLGGVRIWVIQWLQVILLH